MRIALLSDGLPPIVNGGMQKYALNMARSLSDLGVGIDLYTTCEDGDSRLPGLFTDEQLNRIRLFSVPWHRHKRLPGHYIRESYEIARCFAQKLSIENPVDLIYGHGLMNLGVIEAAKRGETMPPIVTHGHGYNMFQKPATFFEFLKQHMLRPTFTKMLQGSDYIVSLGGKLTEILESQAGIGHEKIIETPVAVDERWVHESWIGASNNINTKVRRVTYLGGSHRCKGVQELAAASRALKRLSFELHIIGPISQNIISKFAVGTVAHGPIYDTGELINHLDRTDILVCPSWSEGMPTVILEAMARRTAIIATDVGAVNVIVDRKNGWLIEPGSVKALVDALRNAVVVTDKSLQDMKSVSRSRVEDKYTWPKLSKVLLEQLHQVVG